MPEKCVDEKLSAKEDKFYADNYAPNEPKRNYSPH